jgi:hypothetical protein
MQETRDMPDHRKHTCRTSLTVRRIVPLWTAMVLCGSLAPAHAGDDPRIRAYEEQFQRMERQMDELRARVRVLEEERIGRRITAQPEPGDAPTAEPAAPASLPAAGSVAAPAVPTAGAAVGAAPDRRVDVLAQEVERIKSQLVLPATKEYKSLYGFGPAASKVYQVDRGLSIGGYGEFHYQNLVSDQHGDKDRFDLERFVLYTGYKFSDRILLNSEIEFEHATTEETASSDDGAASVEFASLDFMLWKPFNVRAGLLLVPMGFVNEIHEPPFFHGVFRPAVEDEKIIPTTWSEGGVGFFGTLAPGLDYRAYLMTGLNAKGFESSGLGEARQKGKLAFADDLAGTVRVDYAPFAWSLLGASFWAGNSGQNQRFDGKRPGVFTIVWETHAQVRYRGLQLRALGAFDHIDDAGTVSRELGETIATDQFGFYAEAAYDVLPLFWPETTQYLASFFRYEIFDTQDGVPHGFARVPGNNVQLYTVGLTYKPHPQVVLKLDYRDFDAGNQQPTPDDVNLGAGFIF